MRPERMSRVIILCKKEQTREIVATLAQLKALHLFDHQRQTVGTATIDIGRPDASAEELSAALVLARNLLTKLPSDDRTAPEQCSLQQRIEKVNSIAQEFGGHEAELQKITAKLQSLEAKERLLERLTILEGPIETLFEAKSVETFLLQYQPRTHAALQELKPLLLKNDEQTVLLVVKKEDASRVREVLAKSHATIDYGSLRGMRGKPQQTMQEVTAQQAQLLYARAQLEHAQHAHSKHVRFLQESEQILALELLKAQAPLHFGTTKHITIIQGYVPQARCEQLGRELPSNILIDIAPAQNAPTLLHNPPPADSFEALLGMYTLPKYDELDPTRLMAVTFPVFFGFMLGDIGYGLCALIAFLALRHYVPKTRQFANILILSAIATILFGVLFGEFFGAESIFGLHLTPVIHRAGDVMTLLGIAVGIGMAHINFGLVLGMINKAREGLFHAIIEKGSWMLLQAGLILLAASQGWLAKIPILSGIHSSTLLAAAALCLAVAGIAYCEGKRGLLELPMILSNTLSYMRLAALGLASVYLALVVNSMAGGLFDKGGLWIVLGAIVLLLGHTLNLALGLLGPFLHALRLHYVEFFSKFYEGGGKPYKPFGTLEGTS